MEGLLDKIQIGRDDAESDRDLVHYFLGTPIVNEVMAGDKWLVIGRKGTGKTATWKMVRALVRVKAVLGTIPLLVPFGPMLGSQSGENELVISLSTDEYSWSALKQYRDLIIPVEHAYTHAWKFTLVMTMVSEFLNRFGVVGRLAALHDFLLENFGSTGKLSLEAISAKLRTKRIEEFQVGPLGLKVSDAALASTILTTLQEALLEALKDHKVRIRVSVDRLDECWDGSTESKALLVGLIRAAYELNGALGACVTTTVFLRSDIYGMLAFDYKDRVRQFEVEIKWGKEELEELIAQRIRYSAKLVAGRAASFYWDSAFSKKRHKGKETSLKFITDRTFLRPRDMISFCRKSIEIARERRHEFVEPDDVRTAFEDYSRWKKNDLTNSEYRIKYPWLEELMEALKGMTHKITVEQLNLRLNERKGRSLTLDIKSMSIDKMTEILFETNVLGIYPNLYRYVDPNVTIDSNIGKPLVIHPAFRRALGVTLKYTARKAPSA